MDLYNKKIWVSTFISENHYGEQVGAYTNIRELNVNLQYMENEIEFKTYGEVTNSIIEIRTDSIPNILKGDYIYLIKPAIKNTSVIKGKTYNDYGVGEYTVESIRTNLLGTNLIKNKTTIIARKAKTNN